MNLVLRGLFLEGDGAKSTLVLEKCPKQDIGLCLAPLYQQAFRWFREKYNLTSYIHPLALLQDTKKWCYEITNFESSWDEDIDLHSPEEAELACLIKLIEIVKQQK
jgi:hypothetical protein